MMQPRITEVVRTTQGHGFSVCKSNGAMVTFEFKMVEAAENAHIQIQAIIAAVHEITIHGN